MPMRYAPDGTAARVDPSRGDTAETLGRVVAPLAGCRLMMAGHKEQENRNMEQEQDMPDDVEYYTFQVHSVVEREVIVRVADGKVEVIQGEDGPSDYDPFMDGCVYDPDEGEWYTWTQLTDVLDEHGIRDAGKVANEVMF